MTDYDFWKRSGVLLSDSKNIETLYSWYDYAAVNNNLSRFWLLIDRGDKLDMVTSWHRTLHLGSFFCRIRMQ